MKRISVAEPYLSGNELEYVADCVSSTWISSNGKYISRFESMFAEFCNVKHAVATNNGTTALHLALVALGVGPGDEVILPTVTYIATANAVTYCGAKPVLVDVVPGTLCLDPADVERRITPRTKVIIPVHLYGQPADMGAIRSLAEKYGIHVVEDAAEAHGAEYAGRKVGGHGTCATFSFFGNKIVTTGEGGMVTTDDDDLAARLRLYRGQGMDPERRYWFPVVGYNYRMTNIQAALGVAQMEHIGEAVRRRTEVADAYTSALRSLESRVFIPRPAPQTAPVCWMYTIYLREGTEHDRDALMQLLDRRGIETRPVFYPMHVLPPYRQDSYFPIADDWARRGINLPTHPLLSAEDIKRVVSALTEALG